MVENYFRVYEQLVRQARGVEGVSERTGADLCVA
jgi:hypothetical protein